MRGQGGRSCDAGLAHEVGATRVLRTRWVRRESCARGKYDAPFHKLRVVVEEGACHAGEFVVVVPLFL